MYLGRNWYDQSNNSIYLSTNGGGTWNPATNFTFHTDVYDVAPYPVSDGTRDQWLWAAGTAPSGQSDKGLFYSADAGVTWSSISGASGYDLKSIAVVHKASPNSPHFYAAKSNGDIIKSTDNGANWTAVLSQSFSVSAVRSNNSNNYVYVATSYGIYRSTDEGNTWPSINSGLGSDMAVQSLAINSSGVLFAGTTGSLYKSTDNGSTWKNVGVMNASSVYSNGTNTWSVSRDNAYVGKYTNGSGAWGSNSYISSASTNFSSEQVYRNKHNGYIYVAGSLNGVAKLYKSTDGGTNFNTVTFSSAPTDGKFLGAVVHPTTTTQMYLFGGCTVSGTWKTLFSSTDGGANWSASSSPWDASGIYVNDLFVLNLGTGGTLFAALSNGKVYKSGDNGLSWTEVLNVGTGYTATSVAINPNVNSTVYVAGTTGLYKSTSSGNSGTWSSIGGGSTKRVIMSPGFSSDADHIVTLSTDGSTIKYSFDGGSNLSAGTGNLPTPINDITSQSSGSIVYVATANGIYSISAPSTTPALSSPSSGSTQNINVALTWQAVTGASGYHVMVSDQPDLSNPNVNNLNNSGASFTNYNLTVDSPPKTYYWKVAANNLAGESGFSAINNFSTQTTGTISLTISGGVGQHPQLSWTSSGGDNGPMYNIFRYSCPYPGSDCGEEPYPLIAQTSSTSFTDYGILIVSKLDATSANYYQVRRSAISNKATALSGGGIQRTSHNEVAAENVPQVTSLNANYPNPFNPITQIKYTLAENVRVVITIYDVLGREVKTVVDEVQAPGYKTVEFDAGNLPSGVYFYRLTAGTFTDIQKMILTK
jgi:hypothetical protein